MTSQELGCIKRIDYRTWELPVAHEGVLMAQIGLLGPDGRGEDERIKSV